MHRAGPAQDVRLNLRQADRADLAFFHQLRHGADRILDRHIGIHAMDIVKVDIIRTKTLERCLAGLAQIVRAIVQVAVIEAARGAVRIPHDPPFGGKHDLVAPPLDRLANELFVMAASIHVGRVQHGDTEFDRPVEGPK